MSPETTLRLTTIGVDDGLGNVVQETVIEVTTVHGEFETPTSTHHALNQCLGNREGTFDMDGTNFMASARKLDFSSGVICAELRTSQGDWREDKIAVRAQPMYFGRSWTHELVIEDTHDSTLQLAVPAICFSLGSPCWDLRLSGDGVLKAICLACDSSTGLPVRSIEHTILLDQFVGNNDGSFNVDGSNFLASARNVRLRCALLCAELRSTRGEWKSAEIPLDNIIRINGHFGAKKASLSCLFGARLHDVVPITAGLHDQPESNGTCRAIDGPLLLYPPLDALEDSYRICHIEPGQWDDPINCTTSTRLAKDEQHYSCLSYVCGDQDNTRNILLNSHTKPVTHNLFVAMRRLRWHGVRTIWIDALCINQADNDEKSAQVSRMAQTYANAFRVIIWLGSFPLNADDLEDHIRALEESMFAAFLHQLALNAHIPEAIRYARIVAKNARQPYDRSRTAVRLQRVCYRLSQSGWFSRTWTVQEYIMARQSVFAFGDEVIDTKAVFIAFHLVKSHMHGQKCCRSYLTDRSDCSTHRLMEHFRNLTSAIFLLVNVADNSDEAQRLSESEKDSSSDKALMLPVYSRQCNCFDLRDKTNALLGVIWGAVGALEVDYYIPVQDLCTDVTVRVLERMNNLDIWLFFILARTS